MLPCKKYCLAILVLLSGVKSVAKTLLHLLYPRLCCCCKAPLKQENILCLSCLMDLPKTDFPARRENELEEIFYGRIDLVAAASWLYFVKESRYKDLFYSLKYKNRPEIGRTLGNMMAVSLRHSLFASCDYLVPVPLHENKLKSRGYNQSEMIAAGLALGMAVQLETNLLKRVSETATQTRKNRIDRWDNVKEAFTLTEKGKNLRGKNILLLDDVITTGATIEACASCFVPHNQVFVVAAAYAIDW